jgi:hypothetical protein
VGARINAETSLLLYSFLTVARPRGCSLHRVAQIENKRIQTYMPQVGFEHTIPVFERAKTVHILDNTATVIGE